MENVLNLLLPRNAGHFDTNLLIEYFCMIKDKSKKTTALFIIKDYFYQNIKKFTLEDFSTFATIFCHEEQFVPEYKFVCNKIKDLLKNK